MPQSKKILILGLFSIVIMNNIHSKGLEKQTLFSKSLPEAKKKIAKQMTTCLRSPDGGQNFINTCYGEAAEQFENIGNYYVEMQKKSQYKTSSLQKHIDEDSNFFKHQIASCDTLPGKTIPYAQKFNWVSDCKLYWSRQYAEYFYIPLETEIISNNDSWEDSIEKIVKRTILY